MAKTAKITRQQAKVIIGKYAPVLWRFTKILSISGSYRRGAKTIGDLDFILADADLAKLLKVVANVFPVNKVWRSGKSIVSFIIQFNKQPVQIEFMSVPARSFGAALLHTTGSSQFNIGLRTFAKLKGFKINRYGIFDRKDNWLAGKNETDVFRVLGLKLIPPEARSEFWHTYKQYQIKKIPNATAADIGSHTWWDKLSAAEKQQYLSSHPQSKLEAVPMEIGKTPIPAGMMRRFHVTNPENIENIKQHGLTMRTARGIEGPKAIYSWSNPTEAERYAIGGGHIVEFYQSPKAYEANPVATREEVPPEHIVAVHKPWHSHYRYAKEENLPFKNIEQAKDAGDDYQALYKQIKEEHDEAPKPAIGVKKQISLAYHPARYPVELKLTMTNTDFVRPMVEFWRYVRNTAAGGHSFAVEADRDSPQSEPKIKLSIDGDGADHIGEIFLNGINVTEDKSGKKTRQAIQKIRRAERN